MSCAQADKNPLAPRLTMVKLVVALLDCNDDYRPCWVKACLTWATVRISASTTGARPGA